MAPKRGQPPVEAAGTSLDRKTIEYLDAVMEEIDQESKVHEDDVDRDAAPYNPFRTLNKATVGKVKRGASGEANRDDGVDKMNPKRRRRLEVSRAELPGFFLDDDEHEGFFDDGHDGFSDDDISMRMSAEHHAQEHVSSPFSTYRKDAMYTDEEIWANKPKVNIFRPNPKPLQFHKAALGINCILNDNDTEHISLLPRANVGDPSRPGSLEFGYHVRRYPWESGNVMPPLTIATSESGLAQLVKTLWQSNAYQSDKIVRSGIRCGAIWDYTGSDQVKGYIGHISADVLYTEEGYVYIPTGLEHRGSRSAIITYDEFFGPTFQPTRDPRRNLVRKVNFMSELYWQLDVPEDEYLRTTGVDYGQSFREEVKIMELLGMAGSAHFTSMVGFPEKSEQGFLMEEIKGPKLDAPPKTPRSTLHLWQVLRCLAKAAAVMAWGSENPDFPVRGWDQIIHLDLRPNNVYQSPPDHCHSCGESACYKIGDFDSALRWPAGDIVNNPYEDPELPGPTPYRKLEVERELSLRTHYHKGLGNQMPERLQAWAPREEFDINPSEKDLYMRRLLKDPRIIGNYSWWTNVWQIGAIIRVLQGDIWRSAAPEDPYPWHVDQIEADSELGVTDDDEASLTALTHMEQETYWRRHIPKDPQWAVGRLNRVVSACTQEIPTSRITIPELLIETTKGLAECGCVDEPPLHWEADGQKMLMIKSDEKCFEMLTSELGSRIELGARLDEATYLQKKALMQGRDEPDPFGREKSPSYGPSALDYPRFRIEGEDCADWCRIWAANWDAGSEATDDEQDGQGGKANDQTAGDLNQDPEEE